MHPMASSQRISADTRTLRLAEPSMTMLLARSGHRP
jgi:hypothetical protein